MKKSIGIFLTFFLLLSFSALCAQDLKALLTRDGKVCFKLNVEGVNLYVSLAGKLTELNANVHYNVLGYIDKVGDVAVVCDISGFITKVGSTELKYGLYKRVEKIGVVHFSYGVDGRLDHINDKVINYDLMSGKVNKIDNAVVFYNQAGEVDNIVDKDGLISFIPDLSENRAGEMKPYWIKYNN
ncbi:hypothetical protein SAMN04488128_1011005 [Chitinophaga eiseniae]|uniref:WG containing repeat-containing protein n=1 Tax=Chitinophaga eiseniae TaxID=634771 RepID=A0A1T4M9G6_9BACT|nr:hypothetical protein [Chitinophaga eiseniae]SJZ63653.1 hypothetical protein SAMN04488128_1011005 [Chitinophaga eiseniae]